MDPATAFQLVCGALQLIEFGIRTATAFKDIYNSKDALTSENNQIDHETQLLRTSISQIASRLHNQQASTPEQAHWLNTAAECDRLAEDLLKRIDNLKLTEKRSKRKVPLQWAKLMRERGRIEKDEAKLQRCRELLDTQMLVNLCRDIDTNNADQREKLEQIKLKQIQDLKVFKQMGCEFQATFDSTASQILQHVTDQEEGTRKLMRHLHWDRNYREDFEHLLQSLGFPTMITRQDDIHDPYPGTFNWMIDERSMPGAPGANFIDWLENGNGIYWINGKAGSGKSTLMKFITEHPKSRNSLERCSGSRRLIIATFFFWRAGNRYQRSISGLLRSLLYRLLFEYPQFAQYIDPSVLKGNQEWSVKRLRATLCTLTGQCQNENVSICLFLDGMDEFEGDGVEQAPLVDLIQDMVHNDNVKAVVSSRPEPLFTDRLSSYERLRLQDLTLKDILDFVEGKLLQESSMLKYKESQPDAFSLFTKRVATKADGVFLWARSALNDLISGLWAKDSVEMLENRLTLLNGSLDGIFEQLLERIHPVHQASAANYLRFENRWASIIRAEAFSIPAIAFGCDSALGSDIYNLMLTDLQDSISTKAFHRCMEKLCDLGISLRSQCAGFLDVNTGSLTHMIGGSTVSPVPPDMEHTLENSALSPLARYLYHSQVRCIPVRPLSHPCAPFRDCEKSFGMHGIDRMSRRVKKKIHIIALEFDGLSHECTFLNVMPVDNEACKSVRPKKEVWLIQAVQNSTRVRLIHRSAWDFLQQHPKGLEFLKKATMSPSDLEAARTRALEGISRVGLFILQDSLASAAENHELERVIEVPKGLDEFSRKAYFWFEYIDHFRDPVLQHEGSDDDAREIELDRRFHWTTACLGRLSQICKQKGILLKLSEARYLMNYLLPLIGSREAEHLSLWLMLASGEMAFALKRINRSHESSSGDLFNAVILGFSHGFVHQGSDEVETDRSLTFKHEFLSGLEIMHRLLEIGLEPNQQHEYLYPLPVITCGLFTNGKASHWQNYLLLLKIIGLRSQGSMWLDEGICTEVLNLAENFLEHGADCNATVFMYFSAFFDGVREVHEGGRYCWELDVEESAYQVVRDFQIRTSSVNIQKAEKHLQEGGAKAQCKVTNISAHLIRTDFQSIRALDLLTDAQQCELVRLANNYLEAEINNRVYWQESHEKLCAAVEEVWFANSQHITKVSDPNEVAALRSQ